MAASAPHLSLSLSRELWSELLAAALPVKLAGDTLRGGPEKLASSARQMVRQLGVRERVAGLLEDRRAPSALVRAKDRVKAAWTARKPGVYRRLQSLVRVEGQWQVDLDSLGTELRYSRQKVRADAYVRGVAKGTIYLLRENLEFPFHLERRIGASVALGNIHYDPGHRAIIGSIEDLGVYAGDSAVMQLLSRLAEIGLEQQLPRVGPVPILKRDQVEDMVGPMGGPLKMHLGVEDLDLEITEQDLTLKVRFGFGRAQLTDSLRSAS